MEEEGDVFDPYFDRPRRQRSLNVMLASLRTGSQRGRKKIRRVSEWDAGEPVDIVFNVPFRPLVISLLHICQGGNQACQS